MFHLVDSTLDKAVTVNLTRTLMIISITLVLTFMRTKKKRTIIKIGGKPTLMGFTSWVGIILVSLRLQYAKTLVRIISKMLLILQYKLISDFLII